MHEAEVRVLPATTPASSGSPRSAVTSFTSSAPSASASFRVYSHPDVVGVDLAGALKNVIAIAAGILEGLGLGHNARAALLTRGLAEISRLGVAMGADPLHLRGARGHG